MCITIGTEECVARFNENEIYFEKDHNETSKIHSLKDEHVCYNQIADYGDNIPLCMSYKPYQNEMVWKEVTNEKKLIRKIK